VQSRTFGGAWLLDALWRRLGIDAVPSKLFAGTRRPGQAPRIDAR
jgi:hypothetical protein